MHDLISKDRIFILGCSLDLISNDKNISVRWEYHDGKLDIPFDGVPYIQLGYQEYQCHQGKDLNVRMKEKKRALKNQAMTVDHNYGSKTRKLTQPSKKMDCPVKFVSKKLLCFPTFKVPKDTKRDRTETENFIREQKSENRLTVKNKQSKVQSNH